MSADKQVRPLPFEALLYHLTQLFHCTPSQIIQEDNNLVMDILTIHNTYAEIDKAVNETEERNRKAKITQKMDMRYLTIAVELEKARNQK